jgi:hypothetical protein
MPTTFAELGRTIYQCIVTLTSEKNRPSMAAFAIRSNLVPLPWLESGHVEHHIFISASVMICDSGEYCFALINDAIKTNNSDAATCLENLTHPQLFVAPVACTLLFTNLVLSDLTLHLTEFKHPKLTNNHEC